MQRYVKINPPFGSSPTCLAKLQAVSLADLPPNIFLRNAILSADAAAAALSYLWK